MYDLIFTLHKQRGPSTAPYKLKYLLASSAWNHLPFPLLKSNFFLLLSCLDGIVIDSFVYRLRQVYIRILVRRYVSLRLIKD